MHTHEHVTSSPHLECLVQQHHEQDGAREEHEGNADQGEHVSPIGGEVSSYLGHDERPVAFFCCAGGRER